MYEPRYGYGKGQRPLWSPRDRDAEIIRRVLRRAGFRDFSRRRLTGFTVEGANVSKDGPEPFFVAYCGWPPQPAIVARYAAALKRAGFEVSQTSDGAGLEVQRRPPELVQPVQLRQGMLSAAVVCAVLATVALLASWFGTGPVRLAGGIGSGVIGALAVVLAGLWYRRRFDEHG